MRNLSKQKTAKFVFATLVAIVLSVATFFALPICRIDLGDTISGSYETFRDSLISMTQTYDGVDYVCDEFGSETEKYNRLIVESEYKVDDCDAVASARYNTCHIFQYENSEDAEEALQYYQQNSKVDNVYYDARISAQDVVVESNATNYKSWGWQASTDYMGINTYKNTLLANKTVSSLPKVVVAVLDSGIRTTHEMFSGRLLLDYAYNFVSNTTNIADDNGHGTHVSGTIAEGTPSNVYILPLKVLDSAGLGWTSYIWNAINHLLNNKDEIESLGYNVRVMNMSIGVPIQQSVTEGEGEQISANAYAYKSLSSAINGAYSLNVVSVVSAGNDAMDTAQVQPANVANAITVSALKKQLGTLSFDASYSNFGDEVDFCAPGSAIESASHKSDTGTVTMSGTSMAAPHVAACVALLYSHPEQINYSVSQITNILINNAARESLYAYGQYALGSAERNNYYGYGLVNIANVGISVVGSVNISFNESTGKVTMAYDTSTAAGYTTKIHYTTKENDPENPIDWKIASTATIYQTTQISAVAYVYNAQNELVQRSETSVKVCYMGNKDLASRYTISAGYITAYTGTELETLVVPNRISSQTIYGVSNVAFNSSPVKTLILPPTVESINENAFKDNKNLEAITCESASVAIGKNAFRNCTNLEVFNIENIISVGDQAFVNVSLDKLILDQVEEVGKNAFNGATFETLLVGDATIGLQSNLTVANLYSYGTSFTDQLTSSTYENSYDLTLQILTDFGDKVVSKYGTNVVIELEYSGLGVSGVIYGDSWAQSNCAWRVDNLSFINEDIPYRQKLTLTLTNLAVSSVEYPLYVVLKDVYGNTVESNEIDIYVVSASTQTYTVQRNAAQYDLYVDGVLVEGSPVLYKGIDYSVMVVAKPGYAIKSITINGVAAPDNAPTVVSNISANIEVNVVVEAKANLAVSFDIDGEALVYVDNVLQSATTKMVARGDDVNFVIVGENGYVVKRVSINGVSIEPQNGIYVIENVTSDIVVDVEMIAVYFSINITYSNAFGGLSVEGANLDSVAYGQDVTFTVSAMDGYKLDFVSVNGQYVEVVNGKFVISNIDEDKDIVVSFERERGSIFSGDNSTIVYYFAIIAGLFVLFVVGSVILKVIKKKRQKTR